MSIPPNSSKENEPRPSMRWLLTVIARSPDESGRRGNLISLYEIVSSRPDKSGLAMTDKMGIYISFGVLQIITFPQPIPGSFCAKALILYQVSGSRSSIVKL